MTGMLSDWAFEMGLEVGLEPCPTVPDALAGLQKRRGAIPDVILSFDWRHQSADSWFLII